MRGSVKLEEYTGATVRAFLRVVEPPADHGEGPDFLLLEGALPAADDGASVGNAFSELSRAPLDGGETSLTFWGSEWPL